MSIFWENLSENCHIFQWYKKGNILNVSIQNLFVKIGFEVKNSKYFFAYSYNCKYFLFDT